MLPVLKTSKSKGRSRPESKQLRERVNLARQAILAGYERKQIVHTLRARFSVSLVTAYAYFKAARKQIDEVGQVNRTAWMAEHIAARQALRARVNDSKELTEHQKILLLLQVLREEAELLGLYDQKPEKQSPQMKSLNDFTDAELRSLIGDPD